MVARRVADTCDSMTTIHVNLVTAQVCLETIVLMTTRGVAAEDVVYNGRHVDEGLEMTLVVCQRKDFALPTTPGQTTCYDCFCLYLRTQRHTNHTLYILTCLVRYRYCDRNSVHLFVHHISDPHQPLQLA